MDGLKERAEDLIKKIDENYTPVCMGGDLELVQQGNIVKELFNTLEASHKREMILREALEEACIYFAINISDEECDACEPGSSFEPEFICGDHRLKDKIALALKKAGERLDGC